MAKSPEVFIVDQDPDARFQVQQIIGQTGFAVSGQAGLGTEAVAQATEAKPDIILCGLKEPIARVVQTIESLDHAMSETPIVVYADAGGLEAARKAMLAGARDFLEGPLKPDQLRKSLVSTLEAVERRHLREAGNTILGTEGSIITVYGAKGGVGKTTISVNLAVAIASRVKQSVVLVDVDDTFGDAATVLALTPDHSVIDGIREMDGADDGDGLKPFLSYHDSGLALLSGPPNPLEWRGVAGDRLQALLHRLARQFDVVLVDTASSLSDVTQSAIEAASLVLWVTTPEYASIRDSLQALSALGDLSLTSDRVKIVLNASSPDIEVQPSSIEEALGRSIFWAIPYDRMLRRTGQMGQTLLDTYPGSVAARNFVDLALVLNGMPRQVTNGGILRRWFNARKNGGTEPESLKVKEETKA